VDSIVIPAPFQEAYEKFIKSITPADTILFANTTLDDIRITAVNIEAD
jgi:hypothetical protein